MERRDDLTDVPGFRAGNAHDLEAATGCTVILCPDGGAVGGVAQCGGAPGTRETDPLQPLHLVQRCHAVLLTGGSAFGLDAAGGVVGWLEERGIGFETRAARVPIVPAAVLYDLGLGRADVRPGAWMGRAACDDAARGEALALGNAGAGAGATVGKVHGLESAMKGGLGAASAEVLPGVFVGVAVAVNAFGDIVDPSTGGFLAGARVPGSDPTEPAFADTVQVLRARGGRPLHFGPVASNTVIAVVATNARLDKEGANILARMANTGLARTVRPVHTLVDGDTVFALAAGDVECDVNLLGAYASDLLARAVVRAVMRARPLHGVPCAHDLRGRPKGMVIRHGAAGDEAAIREVGRSIVTWFRPSSIEEGIPRDLLRHRCLVAEMAGRIVGYLVYGDSDLHPEPGLVEIHWLAVDQAFHGRGAGQALVRSLEEIARSEGKTTLELYTVSETEYYPPYEGTRAFYTAAGFERFYVDAANRESATVEKLYFRKRLTPLEG